jgi:predicted DNA-binding protein (UPF0251 family)
MVDLEALEYKKSLFLITHITQTFYMALERARNVISIVLVIKETIKIHGAKYLIRSGAK